MPSFIEMSLDRLPTLVDEVSGVFTQMESRRAPLRDALLEMGFIHQITPPETSPSVVTVDGALVVNQLSGGDLVHTCAVSAEGVSGEKSFSSIDAAPKLLWQSFFPDHTSRISNAASAVMFLQELILMEDAEVLAHDVRIVDGAWTTALVSVLSDMLRSPESSAAMNDCMLEMFENNTWRSGEALVRALNRRMRPWDFVDEHGIMVAISKSDSQRQYAPAFLAAGVNEELLGVGRMMHDRTLASIVLEPGEMLVPSAMPMARALDSSASSVSSESPIPLNWLSGFRALRDAVPRPSRYEQLEHLYEQISQACIFSGVDRNLIVSPLIMNRLREESWLWSTLFKPSTSDPFSRPMRVDFVRSAATDPGSKELYDYASAVVGKICADTLPEAKEPMSQYMADKAAKEISSVAKMTVDALTANATNPRMMSAIMGNYRT